MTYRNRPEALFPLWSLRPVSFCLPGAIRAGEKPAHGADLIGASAVLSVLSPAVLAFASVLLVTTGGIAIVICVGLWLRFCRYVYDDAVEQGEKPKAAEVIQAASFGMIGRSSKPSALPSPPKSDDTSLAA
jgi:hypothetical protein